MIFVQVKLKVLLSACEIQLEVQSFEDSCFELDNLFRLFAPITEKRRIYFLPFHGDEKTGMGDKGHFSS
jgi:hypothetical protein